MLSAIVTGVAVVLSLVGLTWAQHRATNGRIWSAQWLAFSFSTFGALFFVTGAIGYKLGRRALFFGPHVWTDGMIWNQLAIGGVMLAVASVCWVIALRSYGSTPAARV